MLWKKDAEVAEWVTRFTVGEDYRWDTLLLPYDLEGTRVQAWTLHELALLSESELKRIYRTLDELEVEWKEGQLTVRPEDEDCHTVIELRLVAELGEVGKRIHTGRSRNDQVLVALRLFMMDHLLRVGDLTRQAALELCRLAERSPSILMPGYTHFQRAMPSTAALWALGFAELMASDLVTLAAAHEQTSISPLGSAAGYGVPLLSIPREEQARRLGFRTHQLHVTAVQLSRGKLELQAVHALVQVAATANRLASDLVLFNSSEFGFVTLPEELCTGSSIMPQKRNPDVAELIRAGYHRLLAEMNLLATLPANLPSGYHRDLQLTKEAAMRSLLLTADLLTALRQIVHGVQFDGSRAALATTPEILATSRALEKVRAGAPFRDAYRAAAGELHTLETPEPDAVLQSYSVDGYPGRERPDLVRRLIKEQSQWLDELPAAPVA